MSWKKYLANLIQGWLPQEPKSPRAVNLPIEPCLAQKQTLFPVSGGVLTILGSFAIFFMGLFEVMPFAFYLISIATGTNLNIPNVFIEFVFGCVNISCFIIALKAGTHAIERKRYKLSITGPILLSAALLMTTILTLLTVPFPLAPAVSFGLPLATLCTLSLVLIAFSRKEFEHNGKVATDN